MNRWCLVAAVLGATFSFPQPAAQAATSDGVSFPCTDSFAKRVVVDSGFVDAANSVTQNHYNNPRYWEAAQSMCADFDGDGNEELVTSLASMGGTTPWAFFDVPFGRAAEATYAFPTITGYSGPLYANHTLELVQFDGTPAIRDMRRLFKRRDSHCCPTGGEFIRIIGFISGSYGVLESELIPPPPLHKVRLSAGTARYAASLFLAQKFEEAWYNRAGGRLNCNRRQGLNARRCDVSFVIGDSGYSGPVLIRLFERAAGDQYARIRYRLTYVNEYCLFGQDRPWSSCTNIRRGKARLHF